MLFMKCKFSCFIFLKTPFFDTLFFQLTFNARVVYSTLLAEQEYVIKDKNRALCDTFSKFGMKIGRS